MVLKCFALLIYGAMALCGVSVGKCVGAIALWRKCVGASVLALKCVGVKCVALCV